MLTVSDLNECQPMIELESYEVTTIQGGFTLPNFSFAFSTTKATTDQQIVTTSPSSFNIFSKSGNVFVGDNVLP